MQSVRGFIEPGLGCRVHAPAGPGLLHADTGDVDDGPTALLLHHWRDPPASERRADQIQIDRSADIVIALLGQRFDRHTSAGVIDQHIYPPAAGIEHRLEQPVPIVTTRRVSADGVDTQFVGNFLQRGFVTPGDPHLRPRADERFGDTPPISFAASGDNDDRIYHLQIISTRTAIHPPMRGRCEALRWKPRSIYAPLGHG